MTEATQVALIGALSTVALSLIALFKGWGLPKKIDDITETLDGRFSEWKKEAKEWAVEAAKAAYAKGVSDEKIVQTSQATALKLAAIEGRGSVTQAPGVSSEAANTAKVAEIISVVDENVKAVDKKVEVIDENVKDVHGIVVKQTEIKTKV